ncbi:AttK [Pasteurella multocida subsp. multocida str. Anand1_cattle]|nr:AttK [Pasteurella multocida subsp. multocida str. Anand1_cattle]
MQQFSLLKTKAYINGEYVQAKDHKTFAVTNPANQQIICELPDLSAEETEYAIACAAQAQKK